MIRAIGKGQAGGKENLVPITTAVAEILAGMKLPDVGRIFSVDENQVRWDREVARKAAGLPGFRFHDFRHCFAQDLEDAGVGDAITAALHHSSPALRKRYAHARVETVRAAIETARRHAGGTGRGES